jgi:stage V sporulation protein D (sporulation-specific penicillin-binding protein)
MAARRRKKVVKLLKRMQKKLVVLFLIVFLGLGGLLIRLIYIQNIDGDKYEKIILNQQGYGSEIIPYRRGDILDAKGTALATSLDVYNVILDCRQMNTEVEKRDEETKKLIKAKIYVEPTIKALLACFTDVTEQELRKILKENAKSRYFVLRKRLPYEEIKAYLDLQEDDKKSKNVLGVWFEKEYQRKYPYNDLACKVLGFTGSGDVGIGGLEDYYNSTLNGVDGRRYGYLNQDNSFENTIKEAENGNSIVTTIDVNVQRVVEQKIAQFNEKYNNAYLTRPGSDHAAVIIQNVNDGSILAMADDKKFDLNNPHDLTPFLTQAEISKMNEEAQLKMLNENVWRNYCISDIYEPGSTAKPFTVATGLDSGELNRDTPYYCGGEIDVGAPHAIGCAYGKVHQMQTIEQTLMNSCNVALVQMADQIGSNNFAKYQDIFNFGMKTNIDLPGEARGLLQDPKQMRRADLATNSFGQNFNVTMVQMISAFSALVNGGNYYQPHLVKKIVNENGVTTKQFNPLLLKQVVSKKSSDTVREYLRSVVNEGSGKLAKVPGYSMGGKTGTAEKQPRDAKKYLVSFIGCLPADKPEIAIYSIVDNPNAKEVDSAYAMELTKSILEEILPYLNIFPDEEIKVEEAAVPVE